MFYIFAIACNKRYFEIGYSVQDLTNLTLLIAIGTSRSLIVIVPLCGGISVEVAVGYNALFL